MAGTASVSAGGQESKEPSPPVKAHIFHSEMPSNLSSRFLKEKNVILLIIYAAFRYDFRHACGVIR
jgi:hypothetical protein